MSHFMASMIPEQENHIRRDSRCPSVYLLNSTDANFAQSR